MYDRGRHMWKGMVDFLALIDRQTSSYSMALDYYRALVRFEQHRARLERVIGLDLN